MSDQDRRIKVAVRIRPSLERERYESICARKMDEERLSITNEEDTTGNMMQDYRYDYVFDASDDQRTVYEEAAQEMIDHGLDGSNATIFTYGQTGSGKTYTILGQMGQDGRVTSKSGMFLRVFDDLFSYKAKVKRQKHVVISLAAIEIYVDEVMDLLNNKNKIRLREVGDDTLMPGVMSFVCESMEDVVKFFSIANAFRSVTATKMNDESSRSHALFFIDLFQQPTQYAPEPPRREDLYREDGSINTLPGLVRSRLALVDLAGSERVKRSQVEGQAMVEAQAINKSLTTLGTVINAMYENSKHIPFRESKLTRILRPSFIDKTSRLLLIGQVAPPSGSFSESSGTLRFCDRVKAMKVATASPFIDPEEEHRYLQSLQANEAIAADIRIASALHFYPVQRWRKRAEPIGITSIDAYISRVGQQIQLATAQREEQLVADAQKKAQEEVFAEMRAEMQRREERWYQLQREHTEVEATLAQTKAAFNTFLGEIESNTEAKLTEAKRAKKSRLHAEEKIEKEKKRIMKAEKQQVELDAQLEAESVRKRTNFDDDDDPEAEEWNTFENDWRIHEANHGIVHTFHNHWSKLTKLHHDFMKTTISNEKKWGKLEDKKVASSAALDDTLIPDILEFCVERAVLIGEREMDPRESYAWFDIKGCSKKLKPSYVWNPPLDLSSAASLGTNNNDVNAHITTYLSSDDERSPAQIKSPSPNQSGKTTPMPASAEATPATAAQEPPKQQPKRRSRNLSIKKHDVAEADKRYLMNVYDSATLVADVHKYLASGTVMLKHGRNGKPHRRKFWVSNISLSRELIWVDPENYPGSARNSIVLSDISSVTLGQYSKVFKRHPAEQEKDFYLSFSISLKDGSRTLDIVADTLVDFEAWVLGLCHLAKVDPSWGKPLDLGKGPEVDQLTPREKKLCQSHHLKAEQYIKIKEKCMTHRDEVSMHMRLFQNNAEHAYDAMGGIHLPQVNHLGAVLMTKGELRYHCNEYNVDIFRVCAVWKEFNEQQLVYDPSFTAATSFGITTSK